MNDRARFEYLKKLEEKVEEKEGLPHRHGFPFYKWARDFYETRNKDAFLCAGNQQSKSSTHIRKFIEWAGNEELWKTLWRRPPRMFWYLYPSKDLATMEYRTKWLPEFLPRGRFAKSGMWAWEPELKYRQINAIHFNHISIYFRTYMQDPDVLQGGTADMIGCFVAGTQVLTASGTRPIEKVYIGDLVMGDKGYNRVIRKFTRSAQVFRVEFSGGQSLTGTEEHPIWVNGYGWKTLAKLEVGDSVRSCSWLRQKKSSYSTVESIRENQSTRTIERETTLGAMISIFISIFGNLTTRETYLSATSSTTSISILSTTGLKIFSSSVVPNIPGFTKNLSGRLLRFASSFARIVCVKRSLNQGRQNFESQTFAVESVGDEAPTSLPNAQYAARSSNLDPIKIKNVVVKHAPIALPETTNVYNLTVSGNHTYYANEILTHNCDEELPENLYPELTMRRAATDGYFSMVWTPTLGEPLWKDTIEGRGEREKFPKAFKRQVSLLDCMKYEDGSPSPWSEGRVQQVINSCPTPAEVQRRVYGRYIVSSGLKYPSFNRELNLDKKLEKIPNDWLLYSGVDLGSGGEDGHPSSIVFVAVNQSFTKGRVFEGWRGGREENTSAGDVLNRYRQMKGMRVFTGEYYDSQARDFLTISDRAGEAFQGAFKKQDEGQDILNTLFKNQMLDIDNILELQPLMEELETLLETTKKNKARDDFIDGLRFAVGRIPWDWSSITTNYLVENKTEILDGDALRTSRDQSSEDQLKTMFEQDMEEWNELYDE